MDYISTWILEACDFFCDYIASEASVIMFKKFIEYLDFPGEYEQKCEPASGINLALLRGDENEAYSNEELSYLENATSVTLLYDITQNTGFNFFQVELSCSDEMKDFVACALIKIFNKSFKAKNVFVFKHNKKIAIGSKFFEGARLYDDFCITKWYSREDRMEEILELSYDNGSFINSDFTFISITNEIMRQSHLATKKNYDKRYIEKDFLQALEDIQTSYGIDLSSIVQKYNSFVNEDNEINSDIYRQISDEIRFITPETLSSYEYLEMAQKVEENANTIIYRIDNNTESLILDDLKNFDTKAFANAEEMLKKMDDGIKVQHEKRGI